MQSAGGPPSTTPKKIKKISPEELMIIWADGHETHYIAARLRGMCPCASCKDEMTGMRIILPIHIPDDLEFRKIELVGQYALQFEWSDGHHTGIYSFEYLRELSDSGLHDSSH
jgi:ATP-binding protein involved in chromosome partitioning